MALKLTMGLAVCVALVPLAAGVAAETREWTGDGDGIDWSDPDNWDPAGGPYPRDELIVLKGSPTATADVFASQGGSITVEGSAASATFALLSIGQEGAATMNIGDSAAVSATDGYIGDQADSTGTVTVSGAGSTWTNTNNLRVAAYGQGALYVSNGGAVTSNHAWIGEEIGSDGTATVDGTGSTWTNSGLLYVGQCGTGILTVTNSGAVSSAGGVIGDTSASTGTVTVDGADSTWTSSDMLYVGMHGSGSLSIVNGGAVGNTAGYIAVYSLSSGTVTVDGAGSAWTCSSELYVGLGGSGNLTITNGGAVSNTDALVAVDPSSEAFVTVDGAGSAWTCSSDMYVGYVGSGNLTITNGGAVSNTDARIAEAPSAEAFVTVDGIGSTWTSSDWLSVAGSGIGVLNVTGGGSVTCAEGFIGRASAAAEGTVTVGGDGSAWAVSGSLCVGGGTFANGGTGVLDILPGGTVSIGGALRLWTDGTVNLYGGTLSLAQADPLDPCGGTIGFYCGTAEFDRDLVVVGTNGTLVELLGSPMTIPPAKALRVTGTATLASPVTLDGGTLSAGELLNGALLQFNTGTVELTDANLVVGPGGQLGWVVTVGADQAIDVTNTATVTAGGQLAVDGGHFAAGELVNAGQVDLGGTPSLIGGTALTNEGLLRGTGTVAAALTNTAAGKVTAAAGEHLVFTGASNTNDGTIAADGGTIELSGPLTNTAAGKISGTGAATLAFNGGLVNSGVAGVSFATAGIYGDITNNPGGILSVAGASGATFVGDVVNDGTVYVGPGSTAVFMGHVSGPGDFPGGGLVEFVDGFSPGGSAGVVAFGGSVALASSAALEIELANPDNSDPEAPRYDALDVTGEASLAGTLVLEWLPVPGDAGSTFGGVYELIASEEGIAGEFSDIECAFEAYLAGIAYNVDVNGDGSLFAVELTLHDLIVGDADFDGVVDYDDYAALRDHYGQTAGAAWALGDFDLDGDVDWHDYVALKGHWG